MDIFIILTIAINAFIAFQLLSILVRFNKTRLKLNQLKLAKILSTNADIGDYVCFTGKLSTPRQRAPIDKTKCGYWALVVRGVFTRRRKKPNKGTQTFRPVAHTCSSEDFPFIIFNQRTSIQMNFKIHRDVIINPEVETKTSRSIPWFEGVDKVSTKVWKKKYTTYESTIYSLPQAARLTCWGCIELKTNNSFLISESQLTAQPTLIYRGERSDFLKKLKRQIKYHLTLAISIIIFLCFIWIKGGDLFNTEVILTVSIIMSFLIHLMKKYFQKMLKE